MDVSSLTSLVCFGFVLLLFIIGLILMCYKKYKENKNEKEYILQKLLITNS